jgi:hypothetical protein
MSWLYRCCPKCHVVLEAGRFWPVGWHGDWRRDIVRKHRGARQRRCPECGFLGDAGFFHQSKPRTEVAS